MGYHNGDCSRNRFKERLWKAFVLLPPFRAVYERPGASYHSFAPIAGLLSVLFYTRYSLPSTSRADSALPLMRGVLYMKQWLNFEACRMEHVKVETAGRSRYLVRNGNCGGIVAAAEVERLHEIPGRSFSVAQPVLPAIRRPQTV